MKKQILTSIMMAALAIASGCNSTGQSRVAALQTITGQQNRPIHEITAVTVTYVGTEAQPVRIVSYDPNALIKMPDNSGVWISAINGITRMFGYGVFGWIANSAIGNGNVIDNSSTVAAP